MVAIDGTLAHILRTQTMDHKIDDLSTKLTEINDRLYAMMEFDPQAKERFEKIQKNRCTME